MQNHNPRNLLSDSAPELRLHKATGPSLVPGPRLGGPEPVGPEGRRVGPYRDRVRRILGDRELDEERRRKLLNFVQTYVKLDDKTAPEYEALLRESENQEVQEMFMTWIDEVEAAAREKERQESAEKMRNHVFQLVAHRFGELSERTRRAIAAITSLDELAELANKILVADSLEELKIS